MRSDYSCGNWSCVRQRAELCRCHRPDTRFSACSTACVPGLQERLRQRKEYDIVIGERDILGTQLIRRNDELALLYEKIKIQQSTLNKGQLQYRDR